MGGPHHDSPGWSVVVSVIGVTALILAAVIGTIAMWYLNEPLVRGTVSAAERARFAFGLLFLSLAAYHFIRSGNPLLVAIAVIGFMFLTGWLLVEKPWNEVI